MNRVGSAMGLMFCLPQVWVALVGVMVALVGSNWGAFVDIALYVLQRLS
jgi:hypothetical protein